MNSLEVNYQVLEQLVPEHLNGFDTLLLGACALSRAPDAEDWLAQWVHDGGNLISLYHRPHDNWISPAPVVIGSPSMRWRITDPAAEATLIQPDHPLFTTPNQLTSKDWKGWQKERGLYFASDWDTQYQPMIS